MELVLASGSVYRRALLERLGLPFRARPARVDEEALAQANPGLAPAELTTLLAAAKARSLAADEPKATIIGSDQLVSLDGRPLGKPGTIERAAEQLARLAGRMHELVTALAVLHQGVLYQHRDVTRLWMRPLTSAEIHRYLAADQPLDCAGSYKIEARGIALFSRIETQDHTAIMGLPLIALTTILRRLGYAVP
jgi:septum formation protein